MMTKLTSYFAVLLAISFLTACGGTSKLLPDKKVEYKRAKQNESALEIPPDLSRDTIGDGGAVFGGSTSTVTTYSEYQVAKRGQAAGISHAVLPEVAHVDLKRDGDKRWLVVRGSPAAVWNKVLDFWQDQGILLVEQDPVAGVMKTGWIENRANIKSDFITDFLRRSLDSIYSTGTRDQFRTRLERSTAGDNTEVYLTHSAMVEKLTKGAGDSDTDRTIWTPAKSDPEVEAIMLRRLMTYMGVADERAKQLTSIDKSATSDVHISSLNTGGNIPTLDVNTGFARAWRLVGIAMNRIGFSVEDRNRSAGNYYVRYNDPNDERYKKKGWLSKLVFWSGDEKRPEGSTHYIVNVQETSSELSSVTVRDESDSALGGKTAARILGLINEQLR